MCLEPGSTAAIVVGVTQAVAQAGMSIANFVSQTQAARASERAYQEQRKLNAQAANRAYEQTQRKLKGEYDQAAQKAEELLVGRLQAQGTTLAAGRSGQSIGGLLADAARVEGRDLGSLGMNLAYATTDASFEMGNIFQNQRSANAQAAQQRTPAPSIGGLALELGGAALSGVMAAVPFKAPAAGGGGGITSVYDYKPSAGFNFPSGAGFNYSGGTSMPSLPGNPYTYKR
jgi:hypothetical protein